MGFVKCHFHSSPPSRSAKGSIRHALAPASPCGKRRDRSLPGAAAGAAGMPGWGAAAAARGEQAQTTGCSEAIQRCGYSQ